MRAVPLLLATASLSLLALSAGCEKRTGGTAPTPAGDQGGPASQPSAPTAPKDDIILLGEVGSLTGPQATFGQSTRNGIEMAIEEANAKGGVKLADGSTKKLDVRVYDDQGKPEEAAAATTRLIAQDHVKLILGEVASSNSLAMATKAQAAQVPMITPSSTNVTVTQKGDFIFRVCFIDDFQGLAMARFAHDNLKVKNVAVLKDNKSDYSLGLSKVFSAEFAKMGGKIVGEEAYSQGDTDFRGQLTDIKGMKPEAIYVPGYYTDVGVIARQARELGIKAPLLGGDGWESEKLFELGGSAIDGSYYTNHYSPDDPNPVVQTFVKAYEKKYGSKPESLAALAYDAANVAIAAMERAKDLSGPAVRDEIAKTKDFPGVAGKITLNADRNAVKPAVVLEVKDGKAVFAATVNP